MMQKKTGWWLTAGLVMLLAAGGWLYGRLGEGSYGQDIIQAQNPRGAQVLVQIGKAQLMAEVREDETGRALGLSFRESLGENEGMVFIFPEPERVTFWMKDMNFDLDMVWVAEDKVVEISEGVQAPTRENARIETVTPAAPVEMVVEVPAGWAERNGVIVGDEVSIGGG